MLQIWLAGNPTLQPLELIFLPDDNLAKLRGEVFFGLSTFHSLEGIQFTTAMNPQLYFLVITSNNGGHSEAARCHRHLELEQGRLLVHHFGEDQMVLV